MIQKQPQSGFEEPRRRAMLKLSTASDFYLSKVIRPVTFQPLGGV